MSQISTHVLDTAKASLPLVCRCAWNVRVLPANGCWLPPRKPIRTEDAANCCRKVQRSRQERIALRLTSRATFAACGVEGLYTVVEITFQVRSGESHLHIPLLLSPNCYTTYRGS